MKKQKPNLSVIKNGDLITFTHTIYIIDPHDPDVNTLITSIQDFDCTRVFQCSDYMSFAEYVTIHSHFPVSAILVEPWLDEAGFSGFYRYVASHFPDVPLVLWTCRELTPRLLEEIGVHLDFHLYKNAPGAILRQRLLSLLQLQNNDLSVHPPCQVMPLRKEQTAKE